jgi:hypothetical protein
VEVVGGMTTLRDRGGRGGGWRLMESGDDGWVTR